jgi:hypothetical protein
MKQYYLLFCRQCGWRSGEAVEPDVAEVFDGKPCLDCQEAGRPEAFLQAKPVPQNFFLRGY